MHLRGKDFMYLVTYPGRDPEILLSVPAYDFAWQSYYRLNEPLAVPKGTVIECVAHFDNSEKNPANPDPKATVTWGDQTYEEMMIGYLDYYRDAPAAPKPAAPNAAAAPIDTKAILTRAARAVIRGTATVPPAAEGVAPGAKPR
jgi:hypothetical protein